MSFKVDFLKMRISTTSPSSAMGARLLEWSQSCDLQTFQALYDVYIGGQFELEVRILTQAEYRIFITPIGDHSLICRNLEMLKPSYSGHWSPA